MGQIMSAFAALPAAATSKATTPSADAPPFRRASASPPAPLAAGGLMPAARPVRLRRVIATVGAILAILPAAAQAGTYAGPELLGNASVVSVASAATIPHMNLEMMSGTDARGASPASIAPDAIWHFDTTTLLPLRLDIDGTVLGHVAAMAFAPGPDAPAAAGNGERRDGWLLSATAAFADPAAFSALGFGLGFGLGAAAVAVRFGRPRTPSDEIRQPAMT